MEISNKRVFIRNLRIKRDYRQLIKEPINHISVHPLEDDILEWHYVVRGPTGCAFAGGLYHGWLRFPEDYPLKPPMVYMITPNGKFKCNSRLYPSVSGSQVWSPISTVSSVLKGLLADMTDQNCFPIIGADVQPIYRQQELALQSWSFNLNDRTFCKLFPQLAEEANLRLTSESTPLTNCLYCGSVLSDNWSESHNCIQILSALTKSTADMASDLVSQIAINRETIEEQQLAISCLQTQIETLSELVRKLMSNESKVFNK